MNKGRKPKTTKLDTALSLHISRTTLWRREQEKLAKYVKPTKGRPPVLTPKLESDLQDLLIAASQAAKAYTPAVFRAWAAKFVRDILIKEGLDYKFKASIHWFEGFMRRHPMLKRRKSRKLTADRAKGMNRIAVDAWFLALSVFLFCVPAKKIVNVDDTSAEFKEFCRTVSGRQSGHASGRVCCAAIACKRSAATFYHWILLQTSIIRIFNICIAPPLDST